MPKNLKLKAARAEKDLTQSALAEAAGVSRQTINAIEKGEYNPTINLCRSICKILGIKAMSDDAALYLTDDTERLLTQYAKLDDYGRHTISSVMQVEYDRCSGEK